MAAVAVHVTAPQEDLDSNLAPELCVAVLIVLGLARTISHHDLTSSTPPGLRTVAILPFRSLPAAAGTELLEVRLADVLIARLGQLPNLRVIPLSSSERLRGLDPVDAGHRLGATVVLAGTLQYEGSSVCALVRLVGVQDGNAVWSGTFDANKRGIFAVQDAIVSHVIDELGPRLSSVERTKIARSPTTNRKRSTRTSRAAPISFAANSPTTIGRSPHSERRSPSTRCTPMRGARWRWRTARCRRRAMRVLATRFQKPGAPRGARSTSTPIRLTRTSLRCVLVGLELA